MVHSDSSGSREATAVLCLLRYLGQEDARALDGGLNNRIAACLPSFGDEGERALCGVFNRFDVYLGHYIFTS